MRDTHGPDRVLLVSCAENAVQMPESAGIHFFDRIPQLKQFETGVKNAFSQVSEVLFFSNCWICFV